MNEIATTFIIFTTWGFEFERTILFTMDSEFPLFITNVGQIEVDSKSINSSLN